MRAGCLLWDQQHGATRLALSSMQGKMSLQPVGAAWTRDCKSMWRVQEMELHMREVSAVTACSEGSSVRPNMFYYQVCKGRRGVAVCGCSMSQSAGPCDVVPML